MLSKCVFDNGIFTIYRNFDSNKLEIYVNGELFIPRGAFFEAFQALKKQESSLSDHS